MSGPVDVLAVLDEAADWLYRSSESRGDDERSENVKAVRSAVAELIALVNRLATPDDGELLTLNDYRQIARNTIANVGSAS